MIQTQRTKLVRMHSLKRVVIGRVFSRKYKISFISGFTWQNCHAFLN